MFNPPQPWNAWFALSAQAMRMCWDAQAVMLLRYLRIAKGGVRAEAETRRMIAEKVAALAEAQLAATSAALGAARNTASRKKRWPSTQSEFAATGEGYRNSEPSDRAKLANYILLGEYWRHKCEVRACIEWKPECCLGPPGHVVVSDFLRQWTMTCPSPTV